MSQSWKSPSRGDQSRYTVISRLLAGCPQLLEYLFHPTKAELSAPSEELRKNPYSSGEKVLLQVALDIWNGSGKTMLMDLQRLDGMNLRRAIEAIIMARSL